MKTEGFNPHRSDGFAILDVLVAFGLMAIAVTIFFQYSKQILQSKNEAEMIRQKVLIKSTLLTATACPSILECKGSELRALYDTAGRVLLNNLGTTNYGGWQVRAQCQPDQTIEVRVASFANGRFKPDPLTAKPLDWTNDRGLLIDAGSLCGVIDRPKPTRPAIVLTGEYCEAVRHGSCGSPDPKKTRESGLTRFCCENGKDKPKPQCSPPAKELDSYWDRAGDWGADGSWVVVCQ